MKRCCLNCKRAEWCKDKICVGVRQEWKNCHFGDAEILCPAIKCQEIIIRK
ncbi:MAG: hypothetical protein FWD87_08020 [Spirochaetaceae bacterium]|nr:hypothetical protein [Spirochaetaceae bacterium]